MKLVNIPIDMVAGFNTSGKIIPMQFKLNHKRITVEKVLKTYDEKLVGNLRKTFVCMHNQKDIYELKYEVDNNKWYLFKQ